MTIPIVVFDTNILFSGISWQGSPYHCLQLARHGKVNSLTCREILAELEEKLEHKRLMTSAQAARVIAEILSFSELIKIGNSLRIVTHDPDDNKVLECGVVGKAEYIISGDHHLLDLHSYQNIPIIRAVDFLKITKAG